VKQHRPAVLAPPGSAAGSDSAAAGLPVVALVGRPNVGKSTFLARASGRFAETANHPGTTVALERRRIDTAAGAAWLVDLPGARSLRDEPAGADPLWQLLLEVRPDAILVIVDAGDLGRHLPLVLECRDLGLPVVVAANLADEASARGIEIDAPRLAQLLVAPVHPTCGRSGDGVGAPLRAAVALAGRRADVRAGRRSVRATVPAAVYPFAVEQRVAQLVRDGAAAPRSLGAASADRFRPYVLAGVLSPRGAATLQLAAELAPERRRIAAGWARQVERRRDAPVPLADRLSGIVTSPLPGLPIFAALTVAAFLAVVAVGGWLAATMSAAWAAVVSPALAAGVPAIVPQPQLASALLWALDGGLLAMLSVGIPYVLTFYLLIAALEDSGYLTGAAVLSDRLFGLLGLPGRAAIPLMLAAGCNVPAIYGTRVLATRRERLLASFLVTLVPCSARSAIVIAALAPFVGVGVALLAFVVVAGVTIGAGLAANALVPGRQPSYVLELAPLRLPLPRHVLAKAWWRFRAFVVTATPIMLLGSLVLGLVYETGAWQPLAAAIEPPVRWWLGLPAIAGVAVAFAFLRKELALQLLLAFSIAQFGTAGGDLGTLLSPSQLFVYAVVTSVSVPCIATLAALVSELGSRSAAAISGASIALALGAGGLLARLLGIA
jgi:ferrous iron transport protein B